MVITKLEHARIQIKHFFYIYQANKSPYNACGSTSVKLFELQMTPNHNNSHLV